MCCLVIRRRAKKEKKCNFIDLVLYHPQRGSVIKALLLVWKNILFEILFGELCSSML